MCVLWFFLIYEQSSHLGLVHAVTTRTQQMIMPLIRTVDPLKFRHFVDTMLHSWGVGGNVVYNCDALWWGTKV